MQTFLQYLPWSGVNLAPPVAKQCWFPAIPCIVQFRSQQLLCAPALLCQAWYSLCRIRMLFITAGRQASTKPLCRTTLQGQLDESSGDLTTPFSTRSPHVFQLIWDGDEWRLNVSCTASAYYFQQTHSSRRDGSGKGLHDPERNLTNIFQNCPIFLVSHAFLKFWPLTDNWLFSPFILFFILWLSKVHVKANY